MKSRLKSMCLTAIALGMIGCNVGPDYKKPEVKVPQAWSEPSNSPTTRPVNLTRWWTTFNDPVLDSLIDRAVKQNLDLKTAQARVLEARALRDVSAADEWPTVNADASAKRSRV